MRYSEIIQLDEIIRNITQKYDKSKLIEIMKHADPTVYDIDEFPLSIMNYNNELRYLFLLDENTNKMVGFIQLISRKDLMPNLWQIKGSQVFSPYAGKAIIAKLYKCCFEEFDWKILSDDTQSLSAEKLWTKTLPNLGLKPKIYDLVDNKILSNNGSINVYPDNEPERYCWILE